VSDRGTDLDEELSAMTHVARHLGSAGLRAGPIGRRSFLLALSGAAVGLVAACGNQPPSPAKPDAAQSAAPTAAATAVSAGPKPTVPPQVVVPTQPPAQPTAAAQAAPAATTAPAAQPTAAARPAATIKRGGLLKINSQNDWSTMDVQTSQTGNPDSPLVFDFLTKLERNPQSGAFELKPHLAESWDTSDPTTAIIKLRQGVKFHDGSDLDASVVKWNLERALTHPKSGAKSQLAMIDAIDAVDPLTVRLKLKNPSPTLFVNLTSDGRYVSIMSKAHYDKVGDDGVAKQAVGTGPFKQIEWKAGQSVRYERFDGYWKPGADGKPLPYPDAVELRFQADPNVALIAMRSGELDVLPTVLGKDVPTIKSNPDLVYQEAPWGATVYCLGFNARPGRKFYGDQMKKVRQAAMYAIDREGIAKALGLGLGQAAGYLLAPGQLGYDESLPKYTYDVDKAKQLMAEAGYPGGIDVTLDFISRPEDLQNAQLYQQMLEQIGIRLTLQPSERVAWVQKTLAGDYDFSAFQTGVPRPDSDLTLTAYLATKGTSAWVGLDNPEIDRLLAEGRSTYDLQKRVAAYNKVQTMVHEEAYVGFAWRRSGAWAFSKAVKQYGDPYLNVVTAGTEVWLDR
jgi:peptide/nickel transport system substrate-binding protein